MRAIDCCSTRPIFTIRLRPEPGTEPIRALRGLLKNAMRKFGLRCTGLREERAETGVKLRGLAP